MTIIRNPERQAVADALRDLDRPVLNTGLSVPGEVELDPEQEHLIWVHNSQSKRVMPDRMLLTRFVRLYKETSLSILQFAKRWGVLYSDETGCPCQRKSCSTQSKAKEPIERWRHFSRRAAAVLRINDQLKRGKLGLEEDWRALTPLRIPRLDQRLRLLSGLFFIWPSKGGDGYLDAGRGPRTLELDRMMLFSEMVLWLSLTSPGFRVYPEKADWHLEIDYNGCLLSAIALQLACSLSDASVYICSECALPYSRKMKAPRADQLNFCPRCGERNKAALRQAQRRRRAKMADARRLHGAGRSIPEITMQLGVRKQATVRRWLKGR
jgi:DNA-directed RNA polymerase subunit RPC12/RpoP